MFYFEIENNVLESSNNHPYWRPAILVNELYLSAPLSNENLEWLFQPNEFGDNNIVKPINHFQFKYSLACQVD